jgi:hypothetical protein
MRLGGQVPGVLLNGGWRFVAEDQHNISQRVREVDDDSRLAVNVESGQFGIVRHVVLEGDVGKLGMDPHNTWIVAFKATDPDTGQPITGEPDARVLELMRRYDTWTKRNPDRARKAAEAVVRHREARQQQLIRERARALAEGYLWAGRRYLGMKNNIYVPADIPRGQG